MKHLYLILALAYGANLLGVIQKITPAKEISTLKEYNQLTNEKKPVIILFYAPWCGACKSIKTAYDKAAEELRDTALVVKVNVDKFKQLSQSLSITTIPTFYTRKAGNLEREKNLTQAINTVKKK